MEKIIPAKYNYLSEVFDFLPSHVLLDKGMTGCGGTTLELTCARNSIILVPTINLVENKVRDTYIHEKRNLIKQHVGYFLMLLWLFYTTLKSISALV